MNKKDEDTLNEFLREMSDNPEFCNINISDLTKKSVLNNNLLHVAAIKGQCKLCEILVWCGVGIDQRGEHGYTPLHEAAEQKNILVYNLLIELGANQNVKNDDCLTAKDLMEILYYKK